MRGINIIIILSLFFTYNLYAQNVSGCIIVYPYGAVPTLADIYTIPTGSNVPTTWANTDIHNLPTYSGDVPGVVPERGAISTNYPCYTPIVPTTLRQCAVRITNPSIAGGFDYKGGVLAQNFYRCPIDDYVWLMLFVAGGTVFFFIRKQVVL